MKYQPSLFQATYDDYKVAKPIRLIEFFAGYGSQSLAMKYLGLDYESWRICEWNYKSFEAYKLLHSEDQTDYSSSLSADRIRAFLLDKGVSADWNKPMTEKQLRAMSEEELRKAYNAIIATHNLVDISRVHAEDLAIEKEDCRKHCYIASYSFPCGLAGEKVKTADGYKNIEDIQTGDFVQTHENRYRKVAKTMTKMADGYQTIKATGAVLQVTANHPLYVMRDGSLQWIHASEVRKGDYLSYNINKEEKRVELSDEELWLLGRYVADGFINKYLSYSVLFAVGFPKENEFLSRSPKQFAGRWKKFKKDCWEYRIADKDFQSLCFQFGNGAKNKRLPQWAMDLPKDQLKQFIDGYLSGDGHIRYVGSGKQIMFSTVSKELFMGIQQCLLKLYDRVCTLSIRKDGRKETFNDVYNGQLEIEFEGKSRCQFSDGNHAYGIVRSNERTDEEVRVYNMEVEEDNSYTIDNCIVHNCQDLSLAGKRKLMEKGSGTRSGLLWEFERIMLELQRERDLTSF